MLQSKFGLDMPIYVDSMTNQFNKTYACVSLRVRSHGFASLISSAWPERFYVIDLDGDIAFIAHPHDEWGFDRQRVELDARRSIRAREVDDSARRALLPTDNFRTRDLYSRLQLNRAVSLSAAKFNAIWYHYDKRRTGSLSKELAMLFLKELAEELQVEFNEDRALVIIESCHAPENQQLSKKLFEKVFAIWSNDHGISLSDSLTDAAELKPVVAP